jgi:hypothetical protein
LDLRRLEELHQIDARLHHARDCAHDLVAVVALELNARDVRVRALRLFEHTPRGRGLGRGDRRGVLDEEIAERHRAADRTPEL